MSEQIEYVVKKKGKYMSGHSSKGFMNYQFHWTDDVTKARRFKSDDSNSDYFASLTKGTVQSVKTLNP